MARSQRPNSNFLRRVLAVLFVCAVGIFTLFRLMGDTPDEKKGPLIQGSGAISKTSQTSQEPAGSDLGAGAAKIGPAPDGEPAVVAQNAIRENFDTNLCNLVVEASRLGDGSITARCNDGERFRIFSMNSKTLAMRCAAVNALGISGC